MFRIRTREVSNLPEGKAPAIML